MFIPEGEISQLPLKYFAPRNGGLSLAQGRSVAHTCPHCGKGGVFSGSQEYSFGVSFKRDGKQLAASAGASVRFCPNPECMAPVFLITHGGEVIHALPSTRIDFDATGLPPQIEESLEEAIGCHAARCYRASALLVRRTIEEVCKDKSATGASLKARIKNLASVMTLPPALLDAMDQLRLLGNDAAHVDASDYDNIGEAESAAAIMLAKEIVKAGYQYDNLLQALSDLRKDAKASD